MHFILSKPNTIHLQTFLCKFPQIQLSCYSNLCPGECYQKEQGNK